MLRILQFLFIGHVHKWKETERYQTKDSRGSVGLQVICECEKCGRPKSFDLI